MQYELYTDKDSGWLNIPKTLAEKLNLINELSPDSRIRTNTIYIHEGRDLELFLERAYQHSRHIIINQHFSPIASRIRGYTSVTTIQDTRDGKNQPNTPPQRTTLARLKPTTTS